MENLIWLCSECHEVVPPENEWCPHCPEAEKDLAHPDGTLVDASDPAILAAVLAAQEGKHRA